LFFEKVGFNSKLLQQIYITFSFPKDISCIFSNKTAKNEPEV